MRKIALLALVSFLPFGASAARITLRDGAVIYGSFISGSERNIVIQDESGARRRLDLSQVRDIDFQATGSGALDRIGSSRTGDADRTDSRGGRFTEALLPAGAGISVRTNENIDADAATEGRTYSAFIEKDVADGSGRTVAPRGSEARLVVRNVNQGGKVAGGSLMLDLDSIVVDGQRYSVSTEDVSRGNSRGLGANRRTAEMVGGGAVLGTLIGAIAGGGKGAAIGAAAGAAAGAGTQVLTKGDKIRVPAETVLNFRLDQPLRLEAVR